MKAKHKSFLQKTFFHYSKLQLAIFLTLVIFFLLAGGYYMINNASNRQKNSIMENAKVYASITDGRISTDLQGFMQLNLNPENESAELADFFRADSDNRSAEFIAEMRINATESVKLTENLDGLILYRNSDSTLLSTFNEYSMLTKINPAYSYLMNTVAQVDGDESTFVCSTDGSVLYYYPIPTSSPLPAGQVRDCAIAILHQSDGFLNADLPVASSLATFAVLKDGQVISTEGHNALSQKLVANIAQIAKSNSNVYTYTDLNLPDYYFYIVASKNSELTYCYYEPALTGWSLVKDAVHANWWIFLIMLLVAIFSFSVIITATLTKKKEAAERIVNIASGSTTPDNSNFGSLPFFSGIIIDYHNRNGEGTSPENLKLFDMIIRENLTVNKILYQISTQNNSNCLQYYINYTNYNMRVLSDSLKMNLYNAAPDYAINIYYSMSVPSYQEAEKDLLYLHQHLQYSVILGYGIRISVEQIQNFESSKNSLDLNVASTIQNHLRTRAYDDLYNYLKTCTENVRRDMNHPDGTCYSFAEIYRFTEEAFSAVKMFFQENNYSHPLVHTTCISILRTTPGLKYFCDYLISSIQDYQHENQHVMTSRNEQIMNSIYMYIEQDLANANLNSIARKMQMTDSHLSRVFKKNTGANFSEYLSERKLEEACRMLLADNKMKVADIADALGYGNPTYFLSRFKAKYGISPSAYRKTHLAELAQGDNTQSNA